MTYTMADITRRAGVSARTVRDWARHGYVDPPTGHGPAAVYTEEQLLDVTIIARLRAQNASWEAVIEARNGWSLQKKRAFCRKTDPRGPEPETPPAPAAAPPVPPPSIEGEPLPGKLPPPGPAPDVSAQLQATLGADGDDLPGASHFVMVNVLPGLALLMSRDAAPLVKRIAAEMLERYGVGR
jgi:DNA-binding transcriptional MerR regulator